MEQNRTLQPYLCLVQAQAAGARGRGQEVLEEPTKEYLDPSPGRLGRRGVPGNASETGLAHFLTD